MFSEFFMSAYTSVSVPRTPYHQSRMSCGQLVNDLDRNVAVLDGQVTGMVACCAVKSLAELTMHNSVCDDEFYLATSLHITTLYMVEVEQS